MKKNVTAAELMAQLNADPEFVARRKRREEEHQKLVDELNTAEAPLIEELKRAGIRVQSAWDLIPPDCRIRSAAPYPEAIPILLRHLTKSYPDPVLEGIARALAVPEARSAWLVLIQHYRAAAPGSRTSTGLADAIATVADDELIGDVISLLRDPSLGPSRLLLLSALKRSKDPLVYETLLDLASDPELEKEIRVILRKSRRAKR